MYCTITLIRVTWLLLGTACPPPPPSPPPLSPPLPHSPSYVMPIVNDLDTLNLRADLDFFSVYNSIYVDEAVNDDPYFGVKLSSKFHSIESLSSLCSNQKSAVYLSLNVQSLLSKHEQLSTEISELELNNVTIDAIALQETWVVKYTDLVPLNGFNPLIFKRRRDMRGGGVGFYIRNGLTAEIVENLSPFENKIIEALTSNGKSSIVEERLYSFFFALKK
jgi:hypothetical protein